MRKRLTVVLCIILMLSAIPAVKSALADGGEYDTVRVRLSVGAVASLSFFVDGNYTIGDGSTATERDQYTVSLENGSLSMYCGLTKICSGSSIKLVQREATSGRNNFIWLYNTEYETTLKYLGDMEFLINGSSIAVVNHVYMEDYLYGVVPWEIGNTSPSEALKAQAIISRNYAEQHMGSTGSYDLGDTSNDQVYKGYDPSTTSSIQAVDATAGMALTYEGSPVEVFFSASNGGWTEIPQHLWTASAPLMPYQVIQQDTYDIQNPYSKQDILILPKTITDTENISYAYSDDKGGTVTVTDLTSTEIANAAAFLKDSALPSAETAGYSSVDSIVGINSVTAHTLQPQHDISDYYGSSCVCYQNADISMTVLATRPGTPEEQAAGQPTVQDQITVSFTIDMTRLDDKDGGYFVFDEHPSLRLFTVEEDAGNWYICHRRFGHGVGFSQRGAQQRAKSVEEDGAGQDYQQILGFYYPHTDITQQTYTRPVLPAVTIVDHTNASVYLTTSTPLNVRTGPGTSYSKVGTLPNGARIEVVQANAATGNGYTWDKIYFAGQYAYVAINYVTLDNPQPAAQTCTVTFVTNSDSNVSSWVGNHADCITSAPAVSKTGYSFGGWYSDSGLTVPVAFPYIVRDDTTLYAKWDIAAYSISYNLNGGVASNTGSYTVNDTITLSNPTRNEYSFAGWTGTGLSGPTMTVTIPAGSTGDRSYSANWSANTYSISYNLNGGAASNPGSYSTDDTITLQNPTKAGYRFSGWTGTGLSGPTTTVTIPAGSTGNRSYSANWSVNTYSISYNLNGGAASNPGSYTVADTITLTNPTRSGYIFAGWTGTGLSVASTSVTIPAGSTGNREYTANWTAQPQTAYLSGVSLSVGSLNRAFSRTYYSYKVTLGENEGSVTITPFRENDNATMTINNKAVSSYTVSLANGKSTTVSIKVKFGKTSKTYKFTITRAKSTNNSLATLTASAGAFDGAFDPAVTSYVLTLDENTKSVTISDTVATSLAKASFRSKKITLNNGQTKKVTITVKAQSGAKKTYTITVTRAPSTNIGLKYLKSNSSRYPLTPAYSQGVTNYTVTLPAGASSVTISSRALGYKAVVYFDGVKRTSKKITLAHGQSVTIRVTVVAQAGNTQDYYITVTRP